VESPTYIALSRQLGLRRQMDMVANNLANVNTPAYKGEKMMFVEFLSEPQKDVPLSFVQDRGSARDLRSGPLTKTGNPLDFAIAGDGYFTVQTDRGPRYTRAGRFQLSTDRQLTNSQGHALLTATGQPIVVPPGSNEITVAADGTISAGTESIGRIGVTNFANQQAMKREESNLYSSDAPPQPVAGARVLQGSLEESNINSVIELTKMIGIHRTYAANQKLLQEEHERARRAITTLTAQPRN
jgi:flagellar basal-body rod protein FlgF